MEVEPSCSGRRMLEMVLEYCSLGMQQQAVAAAALRQGHGHRCVSVGAARIREHREFLRQQRFHY